MRMIVGSCVLITVNTLIFGFVTWLPQFFVQQGLTITRSFEYTLVLVIASPAGCALGALCADFIGRRMSIIGASIATVALGAVYATFTAATPPVIVLTIGFLLVLVIYVQVAILFGVYTPELFPTEVRLRANGICNTLGRAATARHRLRHAGRAQPDDCPRRGADRRGVGVGDRIAPARAGRRGCRRGGVTGAGQRRRRRTNHFLTYFITRLGPTSAP